MPIQVGIDLGTTNTLVATVMRGRIECIGLDLNGTSDVLKSAMYVDETGVIHVGNTAISSRITSKNVVVSSKRFMGDVNQKYHINGKDYTPTDVATEILKKVKDSLIEELGLDDDEEIQAVITVPAYFNINQQEETRLAGQRAGFTVKQILKEPVAAAIAFVDATDCVNKKVLVVDLGGGTLDLTILDYNQVMNNSGNVSQNYIVKAIGGDNFFGGDNFDNMLQSYLIQIVNEEYGIDLSSQEASKLPSIPYYHILQKLSIIAEKIKITLSSQQQCVIDEPNFITINHVSRNFKFIISRSELEKVCEPLFNFFIEKLQSFKVENWLELTDVEELILVGGSSYIPKIQQISEQIFNKKANVQMDLAKLVVKGACHVADDDTIIIQNIASHSFGVEVLGEKFERLISKGASYPCSVEKIFTTTCDYSNTILINIFESCDDETETDVNKMNYYGRLILEGIEQAPRGVPKVSIRFDCDKDGNISIFAVDKKTGAFNDFRIEKGGQPMANDRIRQTTKSNPIDFMLLMDISGSMQYTINQAKEASKTLITDNIIDLNNNRMGIITFGNDANRVIGLTNSDTDLLDAINSIDVKNETTALAEGIQLAHSELINQYNSNQKVIIIVTDGEPYVTSVPREDYHKRCFQYSELAKNDNVRIIIISVHYKNDKMKPIVSTINGKQDYYSISDISQLANTFKTIINAIVLKDDN